MSTGFTNFGAQLRVLAIFAAAALAPALGHAEVPVLKLPNEAKVETTTGVVFDKNIRPMITPDSASQLRTIADRYRNIIAQGGFPTVPRGTYKKGSSGKGVVILNQRLFMDGYVRVEATQGEYANFVTSATDDGIRRFQRNVGLAVTGKVDAATLYHLNIPAKQRLRTISANIARLEVYQANLGDRYAIVNIAGQQIETVNNGRVYARHNAIVGRPSRPSPVIMTPITDINFNPYWNAPVSIVQADIIPKLRSGTQYLEDMNVRVFKGYQGPEVDPRRVNWRTANPSDYLFRQEPGSTNAMARAKINFKNPFGTYLHDTPEKQLFDSKTRFFSSGCVRVQDVAEFLDWVLNGQDGIDKARMASLEETLERLDVALQTPPMLLQVYLTAWPVGNTVAFRYDIYDLDQSGFTVGQPMPVGELSPDGQRFVLKPLPHLVESLEEGNSGGFFLFGKNRKSGKGSFFNNVSVSGNDQPFGFRKKPSKKVWAFVNGDQVLVDAEPQADADAAKTPKSGTTQKKTLLASTSEKSNAKTKLKKKIGEKPGLFDWTSYRKDQAAKSKKGKKLVKMVKADDKKLAKKTTKVTDKSKTATKKPVVKKVDACKTAKDGKLPDGCKAAAVVKEKPETAAN